MAEMEGINADEMEKLIQFQDLTGIEDINECKENLQSHGWDLEVAVQDTLNVQEGRPSVFNQDTPRLQQTDDITQEIVPRNEGRFIPVRDPNQNLLSYVISIVYNVVTQTVWSFFSFFMKFIRPGRRSLTGGIRSEPVEDVERFIENFNESYTANVEMRPAFWRSSYSQALAAAKQELKFLLIYLHCKDHQHTEQFCRETLCSILLMEYLRQANWLLWGCDVSSCEGYRVSQALRENSYPFLAVAVLRGTKMTVVERFEGPILAEDLVNSLRNVVSENEMSLIAARAERNERSFTQSLRRQQDEAYQESLLADQLKEVRRREQQEAERQEQERVRQEELERIRKKEEIARLKIELADRLPVEPESDHPNAVHLVIKLPSGRRLERRFLSHHSMQDVYHYVFCHPESPDEFEIATNFPKRVLAARLVQTSSCSFSGEVASLEQTGLRGKQALFVYDLEA